MNQARVVDSMRIDSPNLPVAHALSVPELFHLQVKRNPWHPAIIADGQTLSYAELNQRANQIAHYLRNLGVSSNALVGVCLPRSIDAIVALLGILKAGAAYVPLDADYPQERLAYMIRNAELSILISNQTGLDALPSLSGMVINLDVEQEQLAVQPTDDLPLTGLNHQPAYVIYTSGSTGNPKGVVVEHQSLANLVQWHQKAYGLTPSDRATQFAGLSFDASVWEIWCHLSMGTTLYLVPNEVRCNPAKVLSWLADQGITISFLPTPVVEMLWDFPIPNHLKLRYLLTGGDALRRLPYRSLPFTLVNHYGPTENTVVATSAVVSPIERSVPSIGFPISSVQVYLLDENQQRVPHGDVGELYIGGQNLARGYLNQPSLTESAFITDTFSSSPGARLYRTGDLARYRTDGALEFVGRVDHQIKIRGMRVELGEIEAAILKHPHVKQGIVLAKTDPTGQQILVAYCVAATGGETDTAALQAFLHGLLPDYMIPASVQWLETLPLTPNDKVDRRALNDLSETQIDQTPKLEETPVEGTSTESQIAQIWQELLGVQQVKPQDDFFELGGHSLSAGLLIARLYEQFQIDVTLEQFFEFSTLTDQAALIEQLQRERA